jgi:hypothetical protein
MKFFDLELGGLGAKIIFFDYQTTGSSQSCKVHTFGSGSTLQDCNNKSLKDSREAMTSAYRQKGCNKVEMPDNFLKN